MASTSALYNTRTKRHLRMEQGYYPTFASKPQYVWIVQHVKTYKDGTLRFALFNVEQRRYVGLCDPAVVGYGNREELCAHEEPRGWRP